MEDCPLRVREKCPSNNIIHIINQGSKNPKERLASVSWTVEMDYTSCTFFFEVALIRMTYDS